MRAHGVQQMCACAHVVSIAGMVLSADSAQVLTDLSEQRRHGAEDHQASHIGGFQEAHGAATGAVALQRASAVWGRCGQRGAGGAIEGSFQVRWRS